MSSLRLGALSAIVLLAASGAWAQFGGRQFRGIRWATPESFDGAFMFCRAAFRSQPYGDGGGWSVDYPRSDENLMYRLSELTTVQVSRGPDGSYNHVVVRLNDPLLFRCPFVMMTEVGAAFFDAEEVAALRAYLEKGGFLWVDDFWGSRAWQMWASEIAKVLPPGEFPTIDLPLTHELFHALYDIREIPQIPNIGHWLDAGDTSERGFDSAEPHVRATLDPRGRIMVLATHNTDFGDAFEREGDNYDYFLEFAPRGYAFGVNTLIYAMTH
jgi:hypothetical protein